MSIHIPNSLTTDFYRNSLKLPISLEARNILAQSLAASSSVLQSKQWTAITNSKNTYTQALVNLREFGFLKLSIPYANSLISEISSLPQKGYGQELPGGRRETEFLDGVSDLGSVQQLINDKSLFQLVSLYLGAPAFLHSCQAWWQYPMGPDHTPSNAQLWHRDRDDLGELKLFMYLTDVSDSDGPHAFIPGSHTAHGLSRLFPNEHLTNGVINGTLNQFVDDSYFLNTSFTGKFKKWLGPSGTCFLEDTRGFHRAYIPTSAPRLLLSLVWTIGPGTSLHT